MKYVTTVKFWLVLVVAILAANAVRLAIPQARAQAVSIVPYTVVLAETITSPSGRRSPGPPQTWAARSDGAIAMIHDLPSYGSRQIHFPDGLRVLINSVGHVKSSTRRSTAYSSARDPQTNCTTRMTGEALDDGNGRAVVERVAGYRAARIQNGATTTLWFALDYGCALIKQRMDFGTDGFSELELMSLTPGEPNPGLFDVPVDYAEGPPSSFPAARPSSRCIGDCETSRRAHFERLDREYYAHRP